jgi:parallel beta-helix repeat protein
MINWTLTIELSNIMIEGNGFSISLPAYGEKDVNNFVKQAGPLLSISDRSNIIIKNVTFNKGLSAINIVNSSQIILLENTVQRFSKGVHLLRSVNCSLLANEIADNSAYGVLLQDCLSLNVSHNKISNNGYAGIEIDDLTWS